MFDVARRNPRFRRLWMAQVVSECGDWLSRVAVLTLIGRLSGTGATVGVGLLYGAELATRLLPAALAGPLAGPVADRLPRRHLMVAADLARAGIVLGLLLVDEPGDLPLLFGLVVLQMSVAMFFQSARSASIPDTVPRDDLHAAYALSAATWSTMLSLGALFGGILVRWIGIDGVFLLDAVTYLASAALLLGLRLSPPAEHPEPFRVRDVLLLTELRRGLAHVRSLGLTWAVFAKSFWGAAGGYLVVLSLAARERFGDEAGTLEVASVGTAVGLLYSARGVGTGIGPLLARRLHGSSDPALRRQIAAGFAVGAAGYLLFATCGRLDLALLCVVFAHMGGSTLWVGSTILWQKHVEDRFRGRVYALEFLGMTLSFSLGGFLTGQLYDAIGSLDATITAVSAAVLVLGATWIFLERRRPRVE
jgi:predicted MFS family arabinose efflux permease